jgi:hypothetical protein
MSRPIVSASPPASASRPHRAHLAIPHPMEDAHHSARPPHLHPDLQPALCPASSAAPHILRQIAACPADCSVAAHPRARRDDREVGPVTLPPRTAPQDLRQTAACLIVRLRPLCSLRRQIHLRAPRAPAPSRDRSASSCFLSCVSSVPLCQSLVSPPCPPCLSWYSVSFLSGRPSPSDACTLRQTAACAALDGSRATSPPGRGIHWGGCSD